MAASKTTTTTSPSSSPTATNGILCDEHEERVTEMYCAEHDTVCCALCVAELHRSCEDLSNISSMTKTDTSKEKKKVQTSLKQNLKILNQLKSSRQNHLENLGSPRCMESKNKQDHVKRRSARLREAKKPSEAFTKVTVIETDQDINKDIYLLDDMITKTKSKLEMIAEDNNQVDEFVYVKQGEQLVLRGKALIGKLANFVSNETYEKNELPNVSSTDYMFPCAQKDVSLQSTNSLVGEYDIKMGTDTMQCFVKDMCLLDEDQLVIADSSNNKLKLLDNLFIVTGSCDLQGQPSAMCKTGPTELACIVTLLTGDNFSFIQFASMGDTSLTLTNSFSVGTDCKYLHGICCLKDALFVLCNDCTVRVYSKSGTVLSSFLCSDLKGSTVMANIITNRSDLIVTDGYKKIYILDTKGNRKAKITDKKFEGLYGLWAEDTGEMFVTSYYANTVFLVDNKGRSKREILGKSDGLVNPQAVTYINNSNFLVIGSYGTDKIQVFKLSLNQQNV